VRDRLGALPLFADLDDVHAEGAEHVEVRARVAFDLRRAPEQIHAHVNRPLQERAGDDEPVTAVIAPPAQHRDPFGGEILERRFHRGDDLPARVLHQDHRRQTDLIDRPAIGVPHLPGVEDTHG